MIALGKVIGSKLSVLSVCRILLKKNEKGGKHHQEGYSKPSGTRQVPQSQFHLLSKTIKVTNPYSVILTSAKPKFTGIN